MIHREMERVRHGFTGAFLSEGGILPTLIGLDEEMIREYVCHQEEADDEGQPDLFPNKAPRGLSFKPRPYRCGL